MNNKCSNRRITKIFTLIIPVTVVTIFISLLYAPPYCIAGSFDLNSILKTYLKKNFPWAEIEVSDLKESEELSDLPERILIQQGPPGKTVFLLELRNGKKVNAAANVKAYDWIVLSSKALRKGHYLQHTDVYSTLVDITKIPRGAISRVDHVVGKQLTRSINGNLPVVDIMVREQMLVKKGQIVFLVVESPSFTIRTTGEIRRNTYVGSHAKVINLASKKVISGVLVDENTVKVELH